MKNIWRNTTLLLMVIVTVLASLLLQQCNNGRNEKIKREAAEQIAAQNLKALSDSSVQLKMTRKQLAESDSALSITSVYVEKLIKEQGSRKDKVREVIKVIPVVTQKDMDVFNHVAVDPTDSSRHILKFSVSDYVKSFNGAASFHLNKTDSTIDIKPGLTRISDFKLNFHFVVVKYDDAVNKVTRYKLIPFYTDTTGKELDISDQVQFSMRGVELLDKPFNPEVSSPINKKKNRIVGHWGVGVNPIGFGPVVSNGTLKIGYVPSISFGYFLTFEKR